MKRLLLLATLATLATAKPGLYKEKEDFQFSRSSTDEGSKSGFYGAQRGNMGGNYEKAHNMDGLAQHQMSGLVRQVEGELGDGSKTKTGSVFTAANSRGVYGSGHYDLSNLEGRNFQEGVSFGDSQSQSQSHSSLTAQSGHHRHSSGYNAQSGYDAQSGYNSQSGYNAHSQSSDLNSQSSALNSAAYSGRHLHGSKTQSGYNGYQYLGLNGAETNQQQAENLHAADQYDYGRREANGYNSQSAYNGQSAYDQNSNVRNANSYGTNTQTRVISAIPVRIIGRPGTRVAVPIAAQTYDASNGAAYEQNTVNSDAEVLSNQNRDISYKPTGGKHYESSYRYQKQWEKHDTQPVTVLPIAVPTSDPFPKNSELYEDTQSLSTGQQYESSGLGSHRSHSHLINSYNANLASSSQSHHQSAFNAQRHRSASATATDSDASSQGVYNSANAADTTNQIEDVDSKPKSYHSSYSYHKSWERQGDPYVIKPASSGYNTEASQRMTAASSANQGSWSSQYYGSRNQQAHQNVLNSEDCDESGHYRVARSYNRHQNEEQNTYQQNNEDQEILSQQSQNLEDVTKQIQSKWDKIEDLGQTPSNWDQSEDLQQAQNKWDQSEDLVQQTQNKWNKLEDLGQQAQNKWDQSEDLGQQTQSKWDKLVDTAQQAQSQWDKFEQGGQQTQNQWDKLEDLGQQTRPQSFNIESADQQTQSKWDKLDGQQSQLEDGQQLQNTWSQQESSGYGSVGQETQRNWDNLNIYIKPNNDKIPKPPTDTVPSREQNDNDKKPLLPNFDSHDSNVFGSVTTSSPKEQTVQSSAINNENSPEQSHDPWNINIPFNNNNKYWEPSDNVNSPAPHNYFNRPWFNQFPHLPQSSEQALSYNNYNNHQTHTYNAREHHWPLFPESHPQNSWQESSVHQYDAAELKPSNPAQGTSTLWNLWDKVDAIEKQTISSNKNKTEVSQNSYFSHTGSNHEQTSNNDHIIPLDNQNKPFVQNYGHNSWEPQNFNVDTSMSPTSTTKRTETTTLYTTPTIVNIKPHEGKLPPSDVGRGDIGPEDSVADNTPQSNSQDMFNEFGTQAKPGIVGSTSEHKRYKTPAEIEALSQVLSDDKTTTDSTQNFRDSTFTSNSQGIPKHTFTVTSSTTSRAISGFDENNQYQSMGQYSGNIVTVESGKINEFDQTDVQQAVNHLGQQNKKNKQENVDKEFISHKLNGADSIPQKEQNENHNKPVLEVETSENGGNVPAQSNKENKTNKPLQNSMDDNSPVDIYNSWFHQLPYKPQNRDQTQNNNYNNQRPNTYNNQELNIDQPNDKLDQQNVNFGQQSESFSQVNENFEQAESFGQLSEDFGQQSENFGQQSESFGPQSDNFGQQSENFGQESESFGQVSENFEHAVNIGQQSESFGQQSENFGQQSEYLGQRADQQFESFDPQFEKKELLTEQQFETFGQQVDKLDKQNTELLNSETQKQHEMPNIVTSSESNMHNTYNQQQSEKWDQYEDMKQQVQRGWEQHQNLDEKAPVQETQNLEIIPVEKPVHKIEVPEERAGKPEIVENKDPKSTSIGTETPPETEKPGFWKSVGNKFVSAKDKVFSWFGRS